MTIKEKYDAQMPSFSFLYTFLYMRSPMSISVAYKQKNEKVLVLNKKVPKVFYKKLENIDC